MCRMSFSFCVRLVRGDCGLRASPLDVAARTVGSVLPVLPLPLTAADFPATGTVRTDSEKEPWPLPAEAATGAAERDLEAAAGAGERDLCLEERDLEAATGAAERDLCLEERDLRLALGSVRDLRVMWRMQKKK